MTNATIHEAKTNLSRLIQKALAGEDVVISNRRTPVIRLQPIQKPKSLRRIGSVKNFVKHMAADFSAPLDDFSEYHQ